MRGIFRMTSIGMMVSIDLVLQIYKESQVKLSTYLSVEIVDEGSPEDQVGYAQGNDKDYESSHSSVDDALILSIGSFFEARYKASERVLDESKLYDVELKEIIRVDQVHGVPAIRLVVDIVLHGLLKSLKVPCQH